MHNKNDEVKQLDVPLILRISEVYVHAGHFSFAAYQSNSEDSNDKNKLVATYKA